MKKIFLIGVLFASIMSFNASAQTRVTVTTQHRNGYSENHGGTFNLGVGIGYYGYINHSIPVLMANYEFDVARNLTLAPFVGLYAYKDNYIWQGNYYAYHETTIPIGLKGAFYLDELVGAGSDWDFYLALSVGANLHSQSWDNGYGGDRTVVHKNSALYTTGHIGARYHLSNKVGVFLDLSTGVSSVGLSF
jgi:hypothetical protein